MIKRILVPLDGSPLAEKALPYAVALAERFEAELFLVRVLQPMIIVSEYGGYGGTPFYGQQIAEEEAEAKEYLKAKQRELRQLNRPTQTAVLSGSPVAEAIIDRASGETVDLIVMSTHGRSGISRWVYGSVANKVLQRAPCPVFLVRASEAEC